MNNIIMRAIFIMLDLALYQSIVHDIYKTYRPNSIFAKKHYIVDLW